MNAGMQKGARATKLTDIDAVERETRLVPALDINLSLTDADICGMRARVLLEMALEERGVIDNTRLEALIGSALTELDLVDASVKATFELAGIKAR
jgi:hypothetical protein